MLQLLKSDKHEMEDGKEASQVWKDWEQIYSPSPLQAQPHNEAQAHSRRRETVILHDDCSIFPPSDHEGLHIPLESEQQHPQQRQDEEEHGPPTPEPHSSPSNIDMVGPLRLLFDSRLRFAGDLVMKRLSLGSEVLRTKLISLVSSARSYAISREANWSFTRITSVAAVFLISLMFLRWQRWRRRSRQEKKDRLILLIRKQDEKINQLVEQITQLNELLSGRRRVPLRSH